MEGEKSSSKFFFLSFSLLLSSSISMDPEHGAVKASSGSKEKKQKQKQKQKQQTHSKRQEATGCEFEARGFFKDFEVETEGTFNLHDTPSPDKLVKRIPHRQATQRSDVYVSTRSNPRAQLRRAQNLLDDK